jgi:acyl dehydratase
MSGETRPEFVDPSRDDFHATPAFLASLAAGRRLPIDFPSLGGIPMDGGKAVTCLKPVKPGVPLTGRTHLHDIYAKQGRSGRMVFLVARMEIFDQAGTHLATSDSRMVIREKPEKGSDT